MINNKEKNFISAVVYVYNDSKFIKQFLVLLNEVLSANFEKYEIVCVNDASDDESVSIIKETAKDFRGCVLSIVNMSFYHGIESSMNAGIDLAIGDFVYEFDNCYVDYDSSLIIDLYHQSLTGYDVVTATNGKNRFTSKLFYNLYNASSNHKSDLNGETFRILSRRAINRIHSMSKTIPYRKALHAGCGLKLYALSYRSLKSTKISKTRQVNKHRQDTAITTFILFTDLAYRFSMLMTLMMMTATLGAAIYSVVVFAIGKPVEGFTTTMLVITGSFFGVFAILAIIIKYLSVLVDLIFLRQKYLIEGIEKVNGAC